MASLLFEDWDRGQKSDLLGIGDDTKVLRLPAEDVERTAALGELYKGIAEQRKAERESETRPIWSLLNPVGTENLREQSVTSSEGKPFQPVAFWGGRPVSQGFKGMVDLGTGISMGLVGSTNLPSGVRAYHGSPHSFERFDTSKIGTGEGAQAYGHGLYFAEREGVAREYRDALSGDPTIGGKALDWSNPAEHAAAVVHSYDGSRNEAIRDLAKQVAYLRTTKGFNEASNQEAAALRYLQSGKELPALEAGKGSMYEVAIKADPEQMLHWDKPLSQQPKHVQEALAKHPKLQAIMEGQDLSEVPTAGDWVRRTTLNKRTAEMDAAELATMLQEAGVPGIRYLDQGSRGAGEGSHNYVVFDAATIDILRKYGLAGLMLGGGAAAAANKAEAKDQRQ